MGKVLTRSVSGRAVNVVIGRTPQTIMTCLALDLVFRVTPGGVLEVSISLASVLGPSRRVEDLRIVPSMSLRAARLSVGFQMNELSEPLLTS